MTPLEKDHAKKVEALQKKLQGTSIQICCKKDNSSTLRNGAYKKNAHLIDWKKFNRILKLDPDQGWALVEPGVTMLQLCREALKHQLMPPVVPEFASITVGGAIMGGGIESSSFKQGVFFDACLECELVLGNGERVIASASEFSDLFFGISGSFGTLAMLASAKIKLQRAKSHVVLSLKKESSFSSLTASLLAGNPHDFLEGILYSRVQGVRVSGDMVNAFTPSIPVLQSRHFWNQWYAHQIEAALKRGIEKVAMPLIDYLFRYDRGAFWMGNYLNSYLLLLRTLMRFKLSESKNMMVKAYAEKPGFLFRLIFGSFMSSEQLYRLWHSIPNHIAENLFLIQDFFIPRRTAAEALQALIEATGIFPIWLCPVKGAWSPQFLSPHFGEQRFLNIGLYGIPESTTSIPHLTRELEKKTISCGGRKMLYGFTYYPQNLFEQIFHHERYASLRDKYGSQRFPSLYNKICHYAQSNS